MKYVQNRDIKRKLVEFLNKVFALNKEWANSGLEVISLDGNNSPQSFEEYPWDAEKYPLIVLFGDSAGDDQWGVDSFVGYQWESIPIGSTPRKTLEISPYPVAFKVRATTEPMQIRNIQLALQYTGPYEERIFARVHTANGLVPGTVVASGSAQATSAIRMKWHDIGVTPTTIIPADTDYFVSIYASGSYNLMVDNTPDTSITPFATYSQYSAKYNDPAGTWSSPDATKTIYAKVNGPVYHRLGGGVSDNIRIFIEAKDLSTTQKIADLCYMYLHLARHSNPVRNVQLTTPNTTVTDYDFVSNLTDEMIYIINVDKGSEAVRNRGNDRLFSIELYVECYSNWSEDFALPELKKIDTNINSFS